MSIIFRMQAKVQLYRALPAHCLLHAIPDTWGALECPSWFRSSCIGLGHAVHNLYLFILPRQII